MNRTPNWPLSPALPSSHDSGNFRIISASLSQVPVTYTSASRLTWLLLQLHAVFTHPTPSLWSPLFFQLPGHVSDLEFMDNRLCGTLAVVPGPSLQALSRRLSSWGLLNLTVRVLKAGPWGLLRFLPSPSAEPSRLLAVVSVQPHHKGLPVTSIRPHSSPPLFSMNTGRVFD